MTFIQYATAWSKSEVTQGQIMVGIGVLVLVALVGILRSENELLRGSVIPLTLIVIAGIGYGGYVIYSRPAHVKTSIAAYKNSKEEAVKLEIQKHITDNNAGKSLLKYVYPTGLILAALALLFVPGGYYKGMALGFVLLFLFTYVIDYGFVSRSDAFLEFLAKLS